MAKYHGGKREKHKCSGCGKIAFHSLARCWMAQPEQHPRSSNEASVQGTSTTAIAFDVAETETHTLDGSDAGLSQSSAPITLDNDIHPMWRWQNWSTHPYHLIEELTAVKTILERLPESEKAALEKRIEEQQSAEEACSFIEQHSDLLETDLAERNRLEHDLFERLDNQTWERLVPALRLATKFLERSIAWLYKIRHAESVLVQPGDASRPKALVLENTNPNDVQLEQFARELEAEANRFMICAEFERMDHAIMSTQAHDVSHNTTERFPVVVRVSREYIDFLEAADWAAKPSEEIKGFYFYLAVTLVHELAHGVRQLRGDPKELSQHGQEPYSELAQMNMESKPELGDGWCRWMFDGLIEKGRDVLAPVDVLWESRTICRDGSGRLTGRPFDKFTLTKSDVDKWFDRVAWQRYEQGHEAEFAFVLKPYTP